MLEDILILLLGLALVIGGGNYVTDGSVAVARRLGMSPLAIGLTVVALGSSTPDYVVSLLATVHGHGALAVGDVVGADIFDMLLVTGITALISPIAISPGTRRRDLPLLAVGAVLLWVCAVVVGPGRITRLEGAVMLGMFGWFLWTTLRASRRQESGAPAPQAAAGASGARPFRWWLALVMIVGGFAALIAGGEWIVSSATSLARRAGWSEGLIGLTVVAIGSSLPDLATSVMAAVKGHTGLAVGNVVGSCIFDLLLVLGTCAVVRPLDARLVEPLNYMVLAGAAVLLWVLSRSGGSRLTRSEGALLTGLYVAYMAVMLIMQR